MTKCARHVTKCCLAALHTGQIQLHVWMMSLWFRQDDVAQACRGHDNTCNIRVNAMDSIQRQSAVQNTPALAFECHRGLLGASSPFYQVTCQPDSGQALGGLPHNNPNTAVAPAQPNDITGSPSPRLLPAETLSGPQPPPPGTPRVKKVGKSGGGDRVTVGPQPSHILSIHKEARVYWVAPTRTKERATN
jgi:hypothetical protein